MTNQLDILFCSHSTHSTHLTRGDYTDSRLPPLSSIARVLTLSFCLNRKCDSLLPGGQDGQR